MGDSRRVALIDTGAARSLVSEKVWRDYCSERKYPTCVKVTTKLQSVTGMHIPLLGQGEIEIEGTRIVFYISPAIQGILLGDDALRQLDAQINVKEGYVILKGRKLSGVHKIDSVGEIKLCQPELQFVRLTNNAYTPTKGSKGAAGFDLYSAYNYQLKPSDKILVQTDIQVALPDGCYGRIAPRSGLALKHFIDVGAGVIDGDYRGNVGVLLFNFGKKKFKIRKGDRIAQIISERIYDPVLKEMESLDKTDRNDKGFGSSGISKSINSVKLPIAENYWLNKFPKLFGIQGNPIGCNTRVNMKLHLTSRIPIRQRPYRTPLLKRKEIEEQTDELLKSGIIRPSASPWASPVTLVPKKDGGIRMCVDYRRVNANLADDGYPMPRIQDILDSLSGCSFFTLVDLKAGYHQIPVDEESIPITAFVTHQGLYEYTRMPFGLKVAPAIFQRCMNEMLRPVLGQFAMVYLDDICIFSKTEKEHHDHVAKVLKLLEDAGLTAKASKCTFNCRQLEILGYLVDKDGVRPQPKKVEAIKNMAPPTNIKELKRFLGMVGYHCLMIPNFARYSTPLTDLTRKHAGWRWTSEHQAAFDELRTILTSDVIQHYPDMNKAYEVYTDASANAIGGVLIQRDEQGWPRPIQYLSHTLNKTQRLWPAMEREAYAIVCALQAFRPYLYGAQFVIYTDHKPLKAMFQNEVKNTKVQRWAMLIAEYGMPIRHVKGENNLHADFLSRIPEQQPTSETQDIWQPLEISEFHVEDNFYSKLLQSEGINGEKFKIEQRRAFDLNSDKDLVVYEDFICTVRPHRNFPEYPRLWVPKPFQNYLWKQCHKELGHAGNRKVINKLCQYYRWPAMWKTGQSNYKQCGLCCVHSEQRIHALPTKMPVAKFPGDLVATDIVGPFVVSPKGNRYILTVLDHATAWMEAYPLQTKSVDSVISAFHRDYLPRFGAPKVLLTDQGREFQAVQFKDYMQSLGVELRRTTPYHPQTNGRIERAHRTIKQILRKLTNTDANQWEEKLGPTLWAYRVTPSVNGFTPYFLQYGRESRIPRQPLHATYGIENDATERYQQLANSFQSAARQTELVRHTNFERRTRQANASPLEVGDKVVIKAHERAPLDPKWDHPYLVTKIRGSVIFLTDQRSGARRVVNREKVLLAPIDDWVAVKPRVKRTQRPRVVLNLPTPRGGARASIDPGRRRGTRKDRRNDDDIVMTQAKRQRLADKPTQSVPMETEQPPRQQARPIRTEQTTRQQRQPMETELSIGRCPSPDFMETEHLSQKRQGPVTRSMNFETKRRRFEGDST